MVTSSAQPAIQTRGLTKIFRDFWMRSRVTALDGLDLVVEPRQVYGLLGPNGSGKSTTIKILLGLLFPTRGQVAVLGHLPTEVAIKRRIGYLPEETYLYRFLSARETLDYYGRLFHLERRERRRRIEMLLEMVGLTGVQDRPVGEYSKGMQRRIGLAQALINDPDLLILDEPTSGLDPIGTRQIKDLILELRRRGKTVLLSSHLLADVEDVCDRLSILYGGRQRAEGTVDELLCRSDSTLIETDSLRTSTISKIERLIEQEEGKAIRSVEAPRQRLEDLFLSIVAEAQAEGVATSGVISGGAMAAFLSAGEEPREAEGEALLQQLESVEAPQAPAEEPEAPAAAAPSEDSALIEDLTRAAAPPPPPAPAPAGPAPALSAQHGDEEVDKGMLDDLVGGEDS